LFLPLSLYACVPARFGWQRMRGSERRALAFAWFVIAVCVACYFGSEALRVPNIRFVPFIQYLIVIFGVGYLGILIPRGARNALLPVILAVFCLLGLEGLPSKVKGWVQWNYTGFESKPGWKSLREISDAVRGELSDPRVAYEHVRQSDALFGSPRAFENLPYFASRATLDGLHTQMSLLSPFVFYTQSLYSHVGVCPFPDYLCGSMDYSRAADHLHLMNVKELILATPEAKARAGEHERYELVQKIENSSYEVWRFVDDHAYVEVLERDPEYVPEDGFRFRFYHWHGRYRPGMRFLYTLPRTYGLLTGTSRIPLPPKLDMDAHYPARDCRIREAILAETIEFTTDCPGRPHLIKVSYHTGWEAEGALGPYLVSPAFLLVYPTTEKVTLSFRNSRPRTLGASLNLLGIAVLLMTLFAAFPRISPLRGPLRLGARSDWLESPRLNRAGYGLFLAALLGVVVALVPRFLEPSYQTRMQQAQRSLAADDFEAARAGFEEIAERWPYHPMLSYVYFHWASSYLRQHDCPGSEPVLRELLERFPDSRFAVQAEYHLAACAERAGRVGEARARYRRVESLRQPRWSELAQQRLEILGEE
jgi:hypothetical protein